MIISLQARTDQFESSMNRARQDIVKVRQEAQRSSQAFAEFGNSVKNAASAAVSLHVLKSAMSSIVQETIKLDQLTSAFKAITGSAEGARSALAFTRAEASRLGVNAVALAEGFKQISASAKGTALEGQGARDVFIAVAQAGKVLGLSADNVQGALKGISDSLSKGTILAEDFKNQVGDRIPGAVNIMARALGVTTEKFLDMSQKGEISGRKMTDAFRNFAVQLNKEFGGAVAEAAGKADASFARLDNALTDIATTVGKNVNPAMGQLAEAFAKLILSQQETAAGLGEALGPVLRNTGAAALALASGVILAGKGIAALGAFAVDGMSGLNIALADMKSFSDQMNKILDDLMSGKAPGGGVGGAVGGLSMEISKAGDEAKTAHDRFSDWMSPLELAKKKLQEIESQLEKMSKTGAISSGADRAPAALQAKIHAAALKAGVDPYVFESLIKQESNYNPKAEGPMTKYGTAKGLGQLIDSTGKSMGVTDPYDVDQNLAGSARYFAEQTKAFGSVPLGLAAYNAGPGAVRSHGGIPPFKETQAYVPGIMGRADAFRSGSKDSTTDASSYNGLLKERQKVMSQIAVIEADTLGDKAIQEAIEGRAENMQKLVESLKDGTKELTAHETAQIRETMTTVQGFEASKAVVATLLTQIDVRRELVDALKTEEVEYERLGKIQKQIAEDAAKLEEAVDAARTRDSENRIKMLLDESEAYAKSSQEMGAVTLDLFDGMTNALKQGGDAWAAFGEQVVQTLLRIAIEKSGFEEKIGDWLKGGLDLLKGIGGTGSTTDAATAGIGALGQGGFTVAGMATGGFIPGQRSVVVGERGPEIFTPSTAGNITSNSAMHNAYTAGGNSMSNAQGGNTANTSNSSSNSERTVQVSNVFHIQTPDQKSFVAPQSRAQIARAINQSIQATQRSV